LKPWSLKLLESSGPVQACTRIALLFLRAYHVKEKIIMIKIMTVTTTTTWKQKALDGSSMTRISEFEKVAV
jgi:hypothetical protein